MSIGTVVLFPLTLASDVFVAPQTMPGWLQAFVRVNPVTYLVTAERGLLALDRDFDNEDRRVRRPLAPGLAIGG